MVEIETKADFSIANQSKGDTYLLTLILHFFKVTRHDLHGCQGDRGSGWGSPALHSRREGRAPGPGVHRTGSENSAYSMVWYGADLKAGYPAFMFS